jgi:threonine dehydrogenase-like Zn-dependent dehydrogenase
MSRAVIYEQFGGPEVLELQDVAEPHAGRGEIRVRVAAVGLNPMDPAIASMPELAARFNITVPSGFGYDMAGVVDEAGDGASGFAVGERVYGGVMERAAADFVVVKTPPAAREALFMSGPGRPWRRREAAVRGSVVRCRACAAGRSFHVRSCDRVARDVARDDCGVNRCRLCWEDAGGRGPLSLCRDEARKLDRDVEDGSGLAGAKPGRSRCAVR